MSIDTKEKEIGGVLYRVTQLGGKASRAVQLRLARAVAAAFSSDRGIHLGAFIPQAKGVRIDPAEALKAINDADLEFVCMTMAEKSVVLVPDPPNTPKPIRLGVVYDSHFGGTRQLEVWPWLLFCLEVNYGGGFFFAVLERAKAAQEASKYDSRPAPTGSSGGSAPPSA